jgi:hypothetical protein
MNFQDMERYRSELERLDWSKGISKNDLMNRFPNVPQNFWDLIPSNRTFTSFNEFWNFLSTATAGQMGRPGTGGMGQGGH